MDQERVIIRARGLGGYWIPLSLGFIVLWGVAMAFVLRISTNRSAFALWLIIIVIFLVSAFAFEAIVRRTFVEVAGGRIRYFFRESNQRGDRPLSDVRSAYAIGGGGMLVFDDGQSALLAGDLFKREDIGRLVARIHELNPDAAASAP